MPPRKLIQLDCNMIETHSLSYLRDQEDNVIYLFSSVDECMDALKMCCYAGWLMKFEWISSLNEGHALLQTIFVEELENVATNCKQWHIVHYISKLQGLTFIVEPEKTGIWSPDVHFEQVMDIYAFFNDIDYRSLSRHSVEPHPFFYDMYLPLKTLKNMQRKCPRYPSENEKKTFIYYCLYHGELEKLKWIWQQGWFDAFKHELHTYILVKMKHKHIMIWLYTVCDSAIFDQKSNEVFRKSTGQSCFTSRKRDPDYTPFNMESFLIDYEQMSMKDLQVKHAPLCIESEEYIQQLLERCALDGRLCMLQWIERDTHRILSFKENESLYSEVEERRQWHMFLYKKRINLPIIFIENRLKKEGVFYRSKLSVMSALDLYRTWKDQDYVSNYTKEIISSVQFLYDLKFNYSYILENYPYISFEDKIVLSCAILHAIQNGRCMLLHWLRGKPISDNTKRTITGDDIIKEQIGLIEKIIVERKQWHCFYILNHFGKKHQILPNLSLCDLLSDVEGDNLKQKIFIYEQRNDPDFNEFLWKELTVSETSYVDYTDDNLLPSHNSSVTISSDYSSEYSSDDSPPELTSYASSESSLSELRITEADSNIPFFAQMRLPKLVKINELGINWVLPDVLSLMRECFRDGSLEKLNWILKLSGFKEEALKQINEDDKILIFESQQYHIGVWLNDVLGGFMEEYQLDDVLRIILNKQTSGKTTSELAQIYQKTKDRDTFSVMKLAGMNDTCWDAK